MSDWLKSSKLPLRLLRDRRGAIAIMFGLMSTVLVLAVGTGVDLARAVQFRSALQSAVDSAALAGASAYIDDSTQTLGQTVAQNFMNSAIPKLPPNNGVTFPTPTAFSHSTSGVVDSYNVTVSASGSVPTTFMSLVVSSVPVSVTATAKDGIVNATVDFGGWTSDAYDMNSIWWYKVPSDNSTPTFDTTTLSNNTSNFNLLFTNVTISGVPTNLSFSMAAAQKIGFLFVNKVGGRISYSGSNQYGGAQGTSHLFYSNLNPANKNAYAASAYPGSTICNATLQVAEKTGSSNPAPTTGSCLSVPAQLQQYAAPSCSQMAGKTVRYMWNDMGGGSDDFDYNDGQYNFSCSPIGSGPVNVVLTN